MFFADFMRGAQESGKLAVVGMKLSNHVLRADGFLTVIFEALVLRDVANGVKRSAAELARALGNIVGHGKDLVGVLIEQEMIIPEVTPRHVPVKILRLDIEGENIGEQRSEVSRYFRDPIGAESA